MTETRTLGEYVALAPSEVSDDLCRPSPQRDAPRRQSPLLLVQGLLRKYRDGEVFKGSELDRLVR